MTSGRLAALANPPRPRAQRTIIRPLSPTVTMAVAFVALVHVQFIPIAVAGVAAADEASEAGLVPHVLAHALAYHKTGSLSTTLYDPAMYGLPVMLTLRRPSRHTRGATGLPARPLP